MDSVIEKIQKLLALSASPNEHEARLALSKARELMERHNLTQESIETAATNESAWTTEVIHTCGRTPPYDLNAVLGAIAKIFFVRFVCRTMPDGRHKEYVMFGSADNVAVAQHAYVYLTRVFRHLWSEYRVKHGAPTSSARAYYYGLQAGLVDKVLAERRLASSAALVVIESKIDEAMQEHFPRMRQQPVRLRGEQHAYDSGLDHGRSIDLNRPLASGASSRRLSAEDY